MISLNDGKELIKLAKPYPKRSTKATDATSIKAAVQSRPERSNLSKAKQWQVDPH